MSEVSERGNERRRRRHSTKLEIEIEIRGFVLRLSSSLLLLHRFVCVRVRVSAPWPGSRVSRRWVRWECVPASISCCVTVW